MKKKLFTLLLILISMSATAQTVGKPFYIYQHDGSFNAFLKEDVDSITYSNIGLDDKEYDDVVTQLVFTKDSLYRIPIANIDSVSFVTPQTILNKNVFPLTSAHDPYIVNGDTISFKMLLTTPDNMRPKEGNIVISTYDCNAFPVGIIARVTSITKSTDGYAYTCEKASIDDVYDQIVVYEENIAGPDSVHEAKGPMRVQRSVSTTLWDKEYKKDWDIDGTTTNFNANDKAWITITIRKTLKTPLFANFSIQNKLTTKVDFNAKKEIHIDKSTQIGPTLNIGRIFIPYTLLWIQPQLSLDGYFKLDGQVELNYSGHLDRTDRADLTYCNNNWSFTYTPTSDVGTDIANISMKGYAEVGLIPDLFFSLCGSGTGLGMRASVGLKESIDFLFDATKLKGGGLYDACKESYCKTTIPYSVEVYANANLLNNHTEVAANASVTYSKEPQWGSNKYILPLFTTPVNEGGADSGSGNVTTFVSRELLVPVNVGMRIYDSNGNMPVEYAAQDSCSKFNSMKFKCPYSGLQENQEYTACPTVKIFNYTMEATPTAKFKVNLSAITGSAGYITTNSATLSGTVKGASSAKNTVIIGIVYNTAGSPAVNNGVNLVSGNAADGSFSIPLSGLTKSTTYYYCAYIAVDGVYYYGNVLNFTTKKDDDDPTPGDAIDLGLSVKWASHNVGATSPEGYGGYYAWGETEEKSEYSEYAYKYYNSSTDTYINIGNKKDNHLDIGGTKYDVAHAKWGGSWRMPTSYEMGMLGYKCTQKWITYNGVYGVKITGPNGNSIFLPAANRRDDDPGGMKSSFPSGSYWTSSTDYDWTIAGVWCLVFYNDDIFNTFKFLPTQSDLSCHGLSVRPVTE